MKTSRPLLLFIFALLQACGSEQPSGDLQSCAGTLSYQEEGRTVLQQRSISNTGILGQYIEISAGIIADAIMLKADMSGVTGLEVSIYKGGINDPIDANTPILKKFTVSEGLSESGMQEHWLELPEPFEFQARTEGEINSGVYYLLAFHPVDGSMNVELRQRTSKNVFQVAYRAGSPIAWYDSSPTLSAAVGLRGDANCQSSYRE